MAVTSAGNSGPEAGSIRSPGDAPLDPDRWGQHPRPSTDKHLDRNDRLRRQYVWKPSTGRASGPDTGPHGSSTPVIIRTPTTRMAIPAFAWNPIRLTPSTAKSSSVIAGKTPGWRKGENVLSGGAGGFVLSNDAANGRSLNADAHFLPAVHIAHTDGVALKNWLSTGSDHYATITATVANIDPLYGDIMASFSSRGANPSIPSIIKPDVTAPGVDIFAAGGTHGETAWEVMGGTSMSSPHAAGAAALITACHPTWTPAEIHSALMTSTTSAVAKEDGTSSAEAFDMGAGRLLLPEAARAGIVLNESHENFVAADPLVGGDPASLNLASLGQTDSVGSTVWTRELRRQRRPDGSMDRVGRQPAWGDPECGAVAIQSGAGRFSNDHRPGGHQPGIVRAMAFRAGDTDAG